MERPSGERMRIKGSCNVVELARVNRLDLQSAEFRDLFLRYGNADLYEKVQRLASAK